MFMNIIGLHPSPANQWAWRTGFASLSAQWSEPGGPESGVLPCTSLAGAASRQTGARYPRCSRHTPPSAWADEGLLKFECTYFSLLFVLLMLQYLEAHHGKDILCVTSQNPYNELSVLLMLTLSTVSLLGLSKQINVQTSFFFWNCTYLGQFKPFLSFLSVATWPFICHFQILRSARSSKPRLEIHQNFDWFYILNVRLENVQ